MVLLIFGCKEANLKWVGVWAILLIAFAEGVGMLPCWSLCVCVCAEKDEMLSSERLAGVLMDCTETGKGGPYN